MKLKTSDKDLLLILGILVAVIITITTWLQDTKTQASQITPPISPKINSSMVIEELGKSGTYFDFSGEIVKSTSQELGISLSI